MQPDRLDPDAAAAVLARAAALQQAAGAGLGGEGLDDDAVLAVGREVGLGEAAVRRALGEHRAALAVRTPAAPGRTGWIGPPTVSRARVLDVPAGDVADRLDVLLRRAVMVRRRDLDGASVWSPSTGMVAGLRRRVTPPGALAWVSRLQVAVVATDADSSQVLLAASCDGRRRGHRRGAATAAGLAVVGSATAAVGLFVDPSLLLMVPVGAAGVGGLGLVAARGSWLRVLEEVSLSLDGLLDAARHPVPEQLRSSVLGDRFDRVAPALRGRLAQRRRG